MKRIKVTVVLAVAVTVVDSLAVRKKNFRGASVVL